ncbi:hypothetical protein [Motilimonas pumila]|uniref:Uncharacterized protein n=1 Tax=Motilimonas pumila TaxID=2303987 RepID=A0A418YEL9_9GAMM|nr:hypothetical protein [Motilimonas pumila]RJG47592.1 hypothetical protein D1Z90_10680 [Motilimonas pumila]
MRAYLKSYLMMSIGAGLSGAALCASIESNIDVEIIIPSANATPQGLVVYQPNRQTKSYFYSYHKALSPSCRWLSKRLTLLHSWLDSVSEPPYPEAQFILQQEWYKRQRDWIQQGCKANFR